MHQRLAEEWDDIVTIYPDARHEEPPERIVVSVTLENGQYNHERSDVAIIIPPGYRATGPDGFLVPAGLALTNGTALPASDASGTGVPGWLLVSFHFVDANGRSTWHPSADADQGDNLIGYLSAIESFLFRGCN